MENKRLFDAYVEIIKKWREKSEKLSNEVLELLDRGLVISVNCPEKSFLLTGINPSFDVKANDRQNINFVFAEAKDKGKSRYWRKKHKQFGGSGCDLVINHMGYIDLFPLKETSQSRFEKLLLPYNDFRMQLLQMTKEEIERINPKLIVHANKGSLYYWGISSITYSKDYTNPWLNYDFEEIKLSDCPPLVNYEKRLNSFPVPNEKRFVHLYKISGNGFNNGSHFFVAYAMEYYGMKKWQLVQLLTPEEMTELWEWCKKN